MHIVPIGSQSESDIGADKSGGARHKHNFSLARFRHKRMLSRRQIEAVHYSFGDAL